MISAIFSVSSQLSSSCLSRADRAGVISQGRSHDFDFFNVSIPAFQFLFIDFPGYSLHRWPVFNVADIAITVGMMILFIFILTEKPEEAPERVGDAEMIH